MLSVLSRLFASARDPLRSSAAATRWVGTLPASDALQIQKQVLELVGRYPGARKSIGPAQAEALLRVDARVESIIDQLSSQYTANYQRSSGIETRLWHSAFDLIKAHLAAYQATLKAGYSHADQRRWRSLLPFVLIRLIHYKGLDGKFRLFRYGHWIPAQWREFYELYEVARMRGWQREQISPDAGSFSLPTNSVEFEFIKTLLLQRLNSGSFTPDQVEWVSQRLEQWAPPLAFSASPDKNATFSVDLASTHGLQRHDLAVTSSSGRVLYLDTTPVYARVLEQLRSLPEHNETAVKPGELPQREQKLLLMRLAALFGPDALGIAPRAVRQPADATVRVVTSLAAVTRAVAEVENFPFSLKTAVVAHRADEVTQMAHPREGKDTIRMRGSMWRMVDHSDTGYKLVAAIHDAPTKLGELVAIREAESWALGVVRRMQRLHVDELTCGIEIIARRTVRVLLRSRLAASAPGMVSGGAIGPERAFYGLYLPAHPDNRKASQRSLVGPDDKCVSGALIELDTGGAVYLIRYTRTLERQQGWSWGLFEAVRRLTPEVSTVGARQ